MQWIDPVMYACIIVQVESKGRKRGGAKVSIKNSPIMLRDGDTIGIKVGYACGRREGGGADLQAK